jgi:hypothetical protein
MVRRERVERERAEKALADALEDHAATRKDLEEDNERVQLALRERTNAEKKAERDTRLQGVVLRGRAEQQKLACEELARRVVEARREVESVEKQIPHTNTNADRKELAPSEQGALSDFRKRLLGLLTMGGSTNWAPSRPTTPADGAAAPAPVCSPPVADLAEALSLKLAANSANKGHANEAPANVLQQYEIAAPMVEESKDILQTIAATSEVPKPQSAASIQARQKPDCLADIPDMAANPGALICPAANVARASPRVVASVQDTPGSETEMRDAKAPSVLAPTRTPTGSDIISACFQSPFPSSPSEAESVEEAPNALLASLVRFAAPLSEAASAADAQPDQLQNLIVTFPQRPSVGSWLQTRLPAHDYQTQASEPASCDEEAVAEVAATPPEVETVAFNFLPSVGSWLQQRRPDTWLQETAMPNPQEAQSSVLEEQSTETLDAMFSPLLMEQASLAPCQVPAHTPASVVEEAAAPAPAFHHRPSVGAWLSTRLPCHEYSKQPAPRPEEVQVAEVNDVQPASTSSPLPPAAEEVQVAEVNEAQPASTALPLLPVAYRHMPSVGAWLSRKLPCHTQESEFSQSNRDTSTSEAEVVMEGSVEAGTPVLAVEETMPDMAPVFLRASVGTWLQQKPLPRPEADMLQEPLCIPAENSAETASVEVPPSSAPAFLRPSVGSWLLRSPKVFDETLGAEESKGSDDDGISLSTHGFLSGEFSSVADLFVAHALAAPVTQAVLYQPRVEAPSEDDEAPSEASSCFESPLAVREMDSISTTPVVPASEAFVTPASPEPEEAPMSPGQSDLQQIDCQSELAAPLAFQDAADEEALPMEPALELLHAVALEAEEDREVEIRFGTADMLEQALCANTTREESFIEASVEEIAAEPVAAAKVEEEASDDESDEESEDSSEDESDDAEGDESVVGEALKQDSDEGLVVTLKEEVKDVPEVSEAANEESDEESAEESDEESEASLDNKEEVSARDEGKEGKSTQDSDEELSQEDSEDEGSSEDTSEDESVDPTEASVASQSMERAMSATAEWRAAVLGQENSERKAEPASPSKLVKLMQAISVPAGKPPHAPPFEVAKLPISLPSRTAIAPSNVAAGSSGRGSGRSSGQNSAPSSGARQHRALSEGPRQLPRADPRAGVYPAQLERAAQHVDSLLARARAPAPLPRYVAPPQTQNQLKYNPPARDSWEYEKVPNVEVPKVAFTRDIIQVARLETKPYSRKGAKDPAPSRRDRLNGLSNIYGPLVQRQQQHQQKPSRVQSLPALPGTRSPHSAAHLEAQAVLHDARSPQRLMAIY